MAAFAYLLKPFQDMAKELYVNSTLNITKHLIFSVVLVRWCRLRYPLGFIASPLWCIFFHFHYYKFFCVDILKFIRSLFHKVVLFIITQCKMLGCPLFMFLQARVTHQRKITTPMFIFTKTRKTSTTKC